MISNQLPSSVPLYGTSARVTVILTTYNHELFIKEAIDSVLMQEADFGYELVIIDDCSTDRTRDIVIKYQEAYPQKIRTVLPDVNKGDNAEFMKAIRLSASPYIALLDGDDYWTSPYKLQKQVDYLDQHPDCTICFHKADLVYDHEFNQPPNVDRTDQKAVSALEDLLESCFITTCSAMIRTGQVGDFPTWYTMDECADWSLFVLLAQRGKIGYIDEAMSVYRQHSGGFWTGKSKSEQLERVVRFYENLHDYLPAEYKNTIRNLLAKRCYDLALEQEQNGNTDAALRTIKKCLSIEPDSRKLHYWLRTAGGSVAELVFPSDDKDVVRIVIERATGTTFDIQLNYSYLKVKANNEYIIRFRARADGARTVCLGCAEGHEPWAGLGLYRKVKLTSEWQDFEERFLATTDDGNARIHFDFGESENPVDLSAVRLIPASQESLQL